MTDGLDDIMLFILIAEVLPFCAALALALYVARQRRINAILRASLYPYVEARRPSVPSRSRRTSVGIDFAHGADESVEVRTPVATPGGDSLGVCRGPTTRACGYAQTDFENVTGGET